MRNREENEKKERGHTNNNGRRGPEPKGPWLQTLSSETPAAAPQQPFSPPQR